MRKEDLFKAMDGIDDRILEESERLEKREGKAWRMTGKKGLILAAAAAVCVIAGSIGPYAAKHLTKKNEPETAQVVVKEEGIYIPEESVSLAANTGVKIAMVQFFIHDGAVYRFTEAVENGLGLVGDPVGESTGLITEWTEKDGYIDGHGTAIGTYYTVKGYDPAFLLCMKYNDGTVELYARTKGITLTKGSDLYEQRLQLSGNVTEVLAQTHEDWDNSVGNMVTVDPDAAQAFLEAVDDGTFVMTDSIPVQEQGMIFFEKELYHLYYKRADGITVEMRILDGGYVIYTGIMDAAVKIPEESLQTLLASLEGSSIGIVVPEAEVSLAKPAETARVRMTQFYIYQGGIYQYTQTVEGSSMVGELLGTSTGFIDEWTPADGYVDNAGSMTGNYYAVNGYDPSFILCMTYDTGETELYVRNNGIHLTKGAEIFEDRLQLAGNLASATAQSYDDWNNGGSTKIPLSDDTAATFLKALDEGDVILTKNIPIGEEELLFDHELYHLNFTKTDGITAELRVLDNGYVVYTGIYDAAVKVTDDALHALLDSLSFTVGVTIPALQVSLATPKEGIAVSMVQFFIYQGGIYQYAETIPNGASFVGDQLGICTGFINEWTSADGYIDNAGSVTGNYYAVNGYAPSFMLCMTWDTGDIDLYVRNTGITLSAGKELFEDRLALSGNYGQVLAQTRYDWDNGGNSKVVVNDESAAAFLAAVDEGTFVARESIPVGPEEELFSDKELYHLYYQKNDGITVEMRLLSGGYVFYQGLLSAAVQIPSEAMQSLVDTLGI